MTLASLRMSHLQHAIFRRTCTPNKHQCIRLTLCFPRRRHTLATVKVQFPPPVLAVEQVTRTIPLTCGRMLCRNRLKRGALDRHESKCSRRTATKSSDLEQRLPLFQPTQLLVRPLQDMLEVVMAQSATHRPSNSRVSCSRIQTFAVACAVTGATCSWSFAGMNSNCQTT